LGRLGRGGGLAGHKEGMSHGDVEIKGGTKQLKLRNEGGRRQL